MQPWAKVSDDVVAPGMVPWTMAAKVRRRACVVVAFLLGFTAAACSSGTPSVARLSSRSTVSAVSALSAISPASSSSTAAVPMGQGYEDVFFVDPSVGFVDGIRCTATCTGFVLRTNDGGSTWSKTDLPGLQPGTLRFVNAKDGWLVATELAHCPATEPASCVNLLLTTTDGGQRWQTVYQTRGSLTGVQFVTSSVGFAVVQNQPACVLAGCGQIIQTVNGGKTWAAVSTAPLPLAADFLDATDGWILGVSCTAPSCTVGLYATINGGLHWVRQYTTDVPATLGGGYVQFVNPDDGWALVQNRALCDMGGCWGQLLQTTDGGRTWAVVQTVDSWPPRNPTTGDRGGFPDGVGFVSATVGWVGVAENAGGLEEGVLRTSDGGSTWSLLAQTDRWSVVAIAPTGSGSCWIVGSVNAAGGNSLLAQTTDDGQTWRLVRTPAFPSSEQATSSPASEGGATKAGQVA